jgi:hypothetical protein
VATNIRLEWLCDTRHAEWVSGAIILPRYKNLGIVLAIGGQGLPGLTRVEEECAGLAPLRRVGIGPGSLQQDR